MKALQVYIALMSLAAVLLLVAMPAAGQSAFSSKFDHFSTGYPLEGSHRNVDCQRCHVAGIFRGTPRQCDSCHARAGLVKATPMPMDHILSTPQCQDCHRETTWNPVRRVDHSQVIGGCSSCHNGVVAAGKNVSHVQSSAVCEDCHRTTAWIPATFDHNAVAPGSCSGCHNGITATGKDAQHLQTMGECDDCHRTNAWSPATFDHSAVAPGSCSGCHDGVTATGKHAQHLATVADCDDCHTTNAWVPAVFDHGAVMPGSCSGCHNGTTATGKDAQHLQTTGECDACHSTVAWIPANFDHDMIVGSCSSCHNGTTATGINSGHFMTAQDCDVCHTTNFWLPINFMHASPGYPGDHRAGLVCTDCHGGNSDQVTWSAPAYQPDCAGCHAGDFKSGPHKKYENPDFFYTVSELRDCSGACHVYTDSSLTTIKDSRPGPEHRVNGSDF